MPCRTGNQRVLLVEISWTRISRIVRLLARCPCKAGNLSSRLGADLKVYPNWRAESVC